MAYETIEFEIKEHVALITLKREEAANALNDQMADELMDAAIRCDTEKSVRAVLITARGKMFCAGGDLKVCLLYTSPSPRDVEETRMPSSA